MRKDSELSALYDGELEDHEVASIVRSALVDEKQMADWQAYALIGDQLRGVQGQGYRPDFVENVMVCVREEPQVLAPRNLARPSSRHPLLALAASVAGVAVVGWLVLAGPQQAAGPQIAYVAVPPAPTFAKADLNNKSVTPKCSRFGPIVQTVPRWGSIWSRIMLMHRHFTLVRGFNMSVRFP